MIYKANKLSAVRDVLLPRPLELEEQQFHISMDNVRGGLALSSLAEEVLSSYDSIWFKSFITGHSGVGKSTEIIRLIDAVSGSFLPLRFSVNSELDSGAFKPFDVLIIIVLVLVETAAKPQSEGGVDYKAPEALLRRFLRWFAEEKNLSEISATADLAFSLGDKGGQAAAFWDVFLSFLPGIKGELRYSSSRKALIVDYRLQRLSTLIQITNEIIEDIQAVTRDRQRKEWLLIGEDFDKAGIPHDLVEALFVANANLFQELKISFLFTLPIALAYSENLVRLPYRARPIYDTPVYNEDHSPNIEGRQALTDVLSVRMDMDLFDSNQAHRLIVASGGNLRDLFDLVKEAARIAISQKTTRIGANETTAAINFQRQEQRRRLGPSSSDKGEITYPEKAAILTRIYNGDPDAKIATPIVLSLLRSRNLLEFNGEGRFGVPPLVVDILIDQRRLPAGSPGGLI